MNQVNQSTQELRSLDPVRGRHFISFHQQLSLRSLFRDRMSEMRQAEQVEAFIVVPAWLPIHRFLEVSVSTSRAPGRPKMGGFPARHGDTPIAGWFIWENPINMMI